MVKIWLTTVESGQTHYDRDDEAPDETYPDADGVAFNGPIMSVVRRGQIKVLRTDGKPGETPQIQTLAMYPIHGVVRKVTIDE